jgi:translation initiation factor 2 beta subunit (eIF-2beta)/eIF-5
MNFEELLDSVYKQIEDKTIITSKLIIPPPVIEKSTTKTYWKNIKKILITINRPADHFIEFLNKEINTGEWISSSKSDGLVLVGKYNIEQLTKLLHTYIKKNVVCSICNATNTVLEKDKELRVYKINCNKCKSIYTI